MKLAWANDIHLNFLTSVERRAFGASVRALGPDAFLVAGDIADAVRLRSFLLELAASVGVPVYYVLGNHDFYRGSIAEVRRATRSIEQAEPKLRWLPDHGVVRLTDRTALVGHDGWGDTGFGDFERSGMVLNDFLLIEELVASRYMLRSTLERLGAEAASHFERVLPDALERFEHVVVVTHVPPFQDACMYQGAISADDSLPFFACRAVGEVLAKVMRAHPERRMTVLCGHTHSAALARPLPNLAVCAGRAEYGKPALQEPLVVE